jgi:hypothetical protein
MKDAYYFSHDSNAKDDPKCVMLIEKLGMEGYGIFWALVETLREQPEYKYPLRLIPALARRYNTTAEIIQSVINDFGLFEIEDECFFSPSLMRRMKKWNDYREQQRAKAMKRWDRNADAKPSQSHCNTMDNPCKYDGKATVILRKEKKRKEKKEEEKKEEEKKKEEKKKEKDAVQRGPAPPYQFIVDQYNSICTSFPKVKSISEARKKAIRARLNQYVVDDFVTLFKKAETSDFLKGQNKNNWMATFDWLIKDANMAKVLDGNYENKGGGGNGPNGDRPQLNILTL